MRIAYVSHVDSRWIKQRPHFIAESMQERSHEVTYVCSGLVRGTLLVKNQSLGVRVFRIPMLPQRFRRILGLLDPVLSAVSAFILVMRLRPQAVVFTHSRHFRLARNISRRGIRVYYDCMDLNALFSDAITTDNRDERALVAACERTFCSSKPIADHIRTIHPEAMVDVIQNALNPAAFEETRISVESYVPGTIGYVGAISEWFDFDAVLALVNARDDVCVRLWGPCDVEIPAHERIEYLGIVRHEAAVRAMRSCSVLVLPFKITELVAAVDPVKLYEYVATGRPVVACDYPQLEHFGSLISRYSSIPELISKIDLLLDSRTVTSAEISDFIESNSWDARAIRMLDWID